MSLMFNEIYVKSNTYTIITVFIAMFICVLCLGLFIGMIIYTMSNLLRKFNSTITNNRIMAIKKNGGDRPFITLCIYPVLFNGITKHFLTVTGPTGSTDLVKTFLPLGSYRMDQAVIIGEVVHGLVLLSGVYIGIPPYVNLTVNSILFYMATTQVTFAQHRMINDKLEVYCNHTYVHLLLYRPSL